MDDIEVTSDRGLYDSDFYSWTQRQAELLKTGRLDRADIVNIAEEIESLGRSQAAGLESAYRLILFAPAETDGSARTRRQP